MKFCCTRWIAISEDDIESAIKTGADIVVGVIVWKYIYIWYKYDAKNPIHN